MIFRDTHTELHHNIYIIIIVIIIVTIIVITILKIIIMAKYKVLRF